MFSLYFLFLFCFPLLPATTKIIVGNWKAYLLRDEATQLAYSIYQSYSALPSFTKCNTNIVLLPPALYIGDTQRIFRRTLIHVGAQHASPFGVGAFTGEFPPPALKSAGCDYCLVGHYERRHHFGETDATFFATIHQLLVHGITPIYCIGDSADEYAQSNTVPHCVKQIDDLYEYLCERSGLNRTHFQKIIFAYEPIWAIGTGVIPNKSFADVVYCSLHSHISRKYAFNPTILYGGSLRTHNCHHMRTFDGLLVGQASTNAKEFIGICDKWQGFS